MRSCVSLSLLVLVACAPVITRPDAIDTSCAVASATASARWQENEVWGDYVHTKTYGVSGVALYKGGAAVSTLEGLSDVPRARAVQREELGETALGHALFFPSMALGSVGLTVGTAGLGGIFLVDDSAAQLTIALAAGGLMIAGSGLLLVGVISIPSWHRHQVSQEIVSDDEALVELRAVLGEACTAR